MRALITAGGFGTRMLPLTKSIPKEMLPIGQRPALQYVVDELVENDITDIIIVVRRNGDVVRNYFNYSYELEKYLREIRKPELNERINELNSGAEIKIVEQLPLTEGYGNAMPIISARHHLKDEPFILLWGDIISSPDRIRKALKLFNRKKGKNSVFCATRSNDYDKYGFIIGEELKSEYYRVRRILEKPTTPLGHSKMAIMNGYIFTRQIYEAIDQLDPQGGEYQITDAINYLLSKKKEIMYAVDTTFFPNLDIGNPLDYARSLLESLNPDEWDYDKYLKKMFDKR